MKNKETGEARQAYEDSVFYSHAVCRRAIESARNSFLEAKNSARRTRDKTIAKAKEDYKKG